MPVSLPASWVYYLILLFVEREINLIGLALFFGLMVLPHLFPSSSSEMITFMKWSPSSSAPFLRNGGDDDTKVENLWKCSYSYIETTIDNNFTVFKRQYQPCFFKMALKQLQPKNNNNTGKKKLRKKFSDMEEESNDCKSYKKNHKERQILL